MNRELTSPLQDFTPLGKVLQTAVRGLLVQLHLLNSAHDHTPFRSLAATIVTPCGKRKYRCVVELGYTGYPRELWLTVQLNDADHGTLATRSEREQIATYILEDLLELELDLKLFDTAQRGDNGQEFIRVTMWAPKDTSV